MDNELNFLIYNTPEENTSINAVVKDETIWLTQKAMAELFDVEVPVISNQLANIFTDGELKQETTVSKMEIVQLERNRNVKRTRDFYSMVQNKFHYAITGKTAAEIIDTSADKTKENMGLTTWKNAPNGRILKSDVTIGKNYLEEKQIRQLERAVTGYFDYIEDLIERENTFTMEDFSISINEFLAFRKYDILEGKGSISKKKADEKAKSEYDEFNKTQKINSDFDNQIKKMIEKGDEK